MVVFFISKKRADLNRMPFEAKVDWIDDKFEFTAVDTFTANVPTVDENGYIILDSVQS